MCNHRLKMFLKTVTNFRLTGSTNSLLSLSTGLGTLLWHGWLLYGRRQVSCCCQWSASQEVFPEHVGRRVTKSRLDPSGWSVIGQHVELASKNNNKIKSWHANTLSWLVKYMKSEQPMCNHRLKMFLIVTSLKLTDSTNFLLSLSTGSGTLLWHGWLQFGQCLLVL